MLVALTIGLALLGVVTFGSLAGSMLPFLLRRLGLRPGQRVGAVRRDARRRHGAADLLHGRAGGAERHRAVTRRHAGRPAASAAGHRGARRLLVAFARLLLRLDQHPHRGGDAQPARRSARCSPGATRWRPLLLGCRSPGARAAARCRRRAAAALRALGGRRDGQAAVGGAQPVGARWIPAATLGFLFYTFPAWVALFAALRGTEPWTGAAWSRSGSRSAGIVRHGRRAGGRRHAGVAGRRARARARRCVYARLHPATSAACSRAHDAGGGRRRYISAGAALLFAAARRSTARSRAPAGGLVGP